MPQRTVVCKMAPTAVHTEALSETVEKYASACDAILAVAVREKTSNKVKLQHLVYHEVRKRFGLSANLAVRAIARVAWAIKAAKRKGKAVKKFRPTSIDYDERIFAYRENEETVSLTTTRGRIHVPLALGQYQRDALRGKRPTAAKVVRRNREWYVHIVIEDDPGQRSHPICAIGVDRGVYNLAVTSDSAAATGTVAAALALTEEDRDLLVVRHSNGYVESVHGRPAKEILRKKKGEIKDLLGFEDLSLRGIVAFGDWDAAWAYERLCAKAPFVWLDSYAAKHGVKPASSNLREGYRSWTAFPVAHYQGVNSAETAAIALRNAEALMR